MEPKTDRALQTIRKINLQLREMGFESAMLAAWCAEETWGPDVMALRVEQARKLLKQARREQL